MSSNPAVRKSRSGIQLFPYADADSPGAAPAWSTEEKQQQREAQARETGRREGAAEAQSTFEAQVDELRRGIAAALEQFGRERREYFLSVEREVVQLAFNIARKILRRESDMDPLLVAGMVRIALEQLHQATKVTVRVHPQQVSDFRVFFAQHMHMQQHAPEVVEDATLETGRCVLQTELGSTEIGPEIQLKEIEHALMDLQAKKPSTV